MKNSKKVIIIIVIVICLLISILAIILSNKQVNSSNNDNNLLNNEVYEISKEFTRVNNYSEFFGIQNAINNNLELTKHFNAIEIYSNNDTKLNYYFIKGSVYEMLMDDETTSYENVYYLLKLNRDTNSYKMVKLNSNISDLYNYAKNYDIKFEEIENDDMFEYSTDDISVILNIYIEYYKNLLFFEPRTAYIMLISDTKSKYISYEDFYNNIPGIYNNLSSLVYGYSKKENNDYITYNINDNDFNKITINEYQVMDFKIGF